MSAYQESAVILEEGDTINEKYTGNLFPSFGFSMLPVIIVPNLPVCI